MAMIHVNRSGNSLGIFDEARVREGLKTGEFIGTDLGWKEGMPAWRPLSEFESFGQEAPPPVAPSAPAPETAGVPQATLPAAAPAGTTPTITTGAGLPWENREQIGFFTAWLQTVSMVLTRPTEAFTVMRREGNFLDPVFYALIGGTLGAIVSILFSVILQAIGMSFGGDGLARIVGAGVGFFFVLIMVPFFVVIGLFIAAAVFHLCLMIVGGANRSFETTLRVVAYGSGSANLFQMIPLCGGLIAFIWGIVLDVIGIARAHETTTGRALFAVLLPFFLCCGGGVLLAVLVPSMMNIGGY